MELSIPSPWSKEAQASFDTAHPTAKPSLGRNAPSPAGDGLALAPDFEPGAEGLKLFQLLLGTSAGATGTAYLPKQLNAQNPRIVEIGESMRGAAQWRGFSIEMLASAARHQFNLISSVLPECHDKAALAKTHVDQFAEKAGFKIEWGKVADAANEIPPEAISFGRRSWFAIREQNEKWRSPNE